MANIWKQNKDINEKVKRNNFDLSFQNHLTMKMGTLYPVFCREVVPGDSFKISSAFGLKFMPLGFPVQTKMRAHMHYFYVRNKNLWNRWEDWIQGLKGHDDGVDHPYISQGSDFWKVGKLADYMNIPTTLAVSGSVGSRISAYHTTVANYLTVTSSTRLYSAEVYSPERPTAGYDTNAAGSTGASMMYFNDNIDGYGTFPNMLVNSVEDSAYTGTMFGFTHSVLSTVNTRGQIRLLSGTPQVTIASPLTVKFALVTRPRGDTFQYTWSVRAHGDDANANVSSQNTITFDFGATFINEFNTFVGQGLDCAIIVYFDEKDIVFTNATYGTYFNAVIAPILAVELVSSTVDDADYYSPFDNQIDAIRVSALPFRAYESIYRAYYANSVIQPLMINGSVEYNKFNTTTEGGADATDYHLFQRNYELDFLTSALPSPQMGNAPLVGMSALGTITLTDPETGEITTAKATIGENDEIVGLTVTSPIAKKEHAITLQQIASAGFSINDFRNVNALQHWLETNIRKGFRYLDFVEGHTNVRPKYSELDMPEFIGGYSRDVNVSQIVSSADTLSGDSGAALGQFGGMANCFGQSNHTITHFCDDYGFIMGILCITPTPAYSQLLPKHYLKQSPLDYYFPEFAQLGMQPITYEEVCPVQAYNQSQIDGGQTSVTDTFGYQRPNYDMVASVDEIHGQFRKTLSSFLINRVFESRPELSSDFLTIDPDETNQIFIDQAPDADNIIGQIVFDVKAKRPLPRVHMPSLGR